MRVKSQDLKCKTSFKIGTAVVVMVLLGATAFYLYGITVVSWWIPLSIGFAAGLALWGIIFPIWERAWPGTAVGIRFLSHILIATVVLTTLVLGLNRLGVRKTSEETVSAKVESKYQEKRYRSRRVGRGRYVKGEPYTVYHIVYALPDGSQKVMEVSLQTYRGSAINSEIPMVIAKGLFSWPVISKF